MAEKVIIIGAGAYGLAAGCYLQMNGFPVEIFEMHDAPGGVCTAWTRKGYTFDGCIHWLMGSGPGTNMHEMWRELHAVQGRRFVEWDEYLRVRTRGGETFTVYTDPRKLEAEMLRIAPEDGNVIRPLCRAIERMSRVDFPITLEKMSVLERVRALAGMVPMGLGLMKWGSINMETLCSRLRSHTLAEALGSMYGRDSSMTDFPVTGMIMMLAWMHRKSNGYPIGGSREFARAIEQRFVSLGGTVTYRTRVQRILVERGGGGGDRAVGIVAGGEAHHADIVISCADGHATLYDMLGGRYLSPELKRAYETWPVFPSLIYVGIGIDRELSDEPAMRTFPLAKEIVLEDGALRLSELSLRLFTFDPTMAPKGKTAAIVMISTRNLPWWKALREHDPSRYRNEKRRVVDAVVAAVDAEIGGIRSHVETADVATPATWERYTGNWQGSFEGFLPTRTTVQKRLGFTLPGLDGFYMHSQWVSVGGGLPPAGMNGRALAKLICRRRGRKFITVP